MTWTTLQVMVVSWSYEWNFGVVLTSFARVRLALVSFSDVVVLLPIVLRTKSKIAGRVVSQLVLPTKPQSFHLAPVSARSP